MRPKWTKYDRATYLISAFLLLATCIWLAVKWKELPELVPMHYNFQGEIDRYGKKSELLIVPIFGWVLVLLLGVVSRFPKIWNTGGLVLTDENREYVYKRLRYMLDTMMVLVSGAFSFLTVYTLTGENLPKAFLPVFILLLFGSMAYFLVPLYRKNKKQPEGPFRWKRAFSFLHKRLNFFDTKSEVNKLNDKELLGFILNTPHDNMSNEEIIHLLLENTVSQKGEGKETFGQKAADKMAAFAGSWTFILTFTGVLVLWIVFNNLAALRAFDPYPFILLNLVLSCVAAIQAPLIMMSQKRQEEKDRLRSENDYKVNLKSEIILKDLHKKLDYVILLLEQEAKRENNRQGKI